MVHSGKLQFYGSLADKVCSYFPVCLGPVAAGRPRAPALISSFSQAGWMAFFAQLCSEASLPKKARGDLCSRVFIQWTERCKMSSSHYLSNVRGSKAPTSLFVLYINHFGVHLRIQRKYSWDQCKHSSKECLLMVLEMRSWTCCLSGRQRVRKQVDFIKERVEINTQFLMLRDSSAPRLEKAFASRPCGTCLESFPFSLIHLGLFAEVSSWNMSPQPVLQVALFTSMGKHSVHAVPHKPRVEQAQV